MADSVRASGIQGWLHAPQGEAVAALGITHGAGSNCESPLLIDLANAFAERGIVALRYDLPYRQAHPKGPPTGSSSRDQEGVRQVAQWLREKAPGLPVYLAGTSYGGRQTSMAAAKDSGLCDALLLMSYPLHPPRQPVKSRTEHFPALQIPALFVQGTKDEFGTIAELEAACASLAARWRMQAIDGAKHGLGANFAQQIGEWFVTFTKE